MPGFSPVASVGLGPVKSKAVQTPELVAPARKASGRSPIWTALLLAALLVGAAVIIGKPDLSREGIMTSLAWVLTPVPTETPVATPTPTRPAVLPPEYRTAEAQATELAIERSAPLGTRDALAISAPPTQVSSLAQTSAPAAQPTVTPTPTRGEIPAPRLVYPSADQHIDPTYLTLKWEWDGELGEDEYFDVRLWLMGGEKKGIAWTKQHQYIKRAVDAGWHTWTVVVIRGKDGVVQEELSPEPAPVNFWWSVRGKTEQRDPTSVPLPTREGPVSQPTRVSPGGE